MVLKCSRRLSAKLSPIDGRESRMYFLRSFTGRSLLTGFLCHFASGSAQDSKDLWACYLNSLRLADDKGITSISFPAISTGAFGYPIEQVARISLSAVRDYIMKGTRIKLVRFVLFTQVDYDVYCEALKSLAGK